ncbi:MAG TPA: ABC transporter permease [Longimicrobiales bacterium]|nr:ABC transporter permease [Longimicrobiales bacterium]
MNALPKDLRVGFRKLVRDPSLTVTAVLALTLGIGLTTMTFSIVYGALYRGLPFEDADRIVHLERSNLAAEIESMEVTIHDFVDWRAEQRSFHDLAAAYVGTINIMGDERPERYDGAFITPSAFAMLGVAPVLGRTFTEEDDDPSAPLVVLIGHAAWQAQFNGDPDVVGRGVRVNGQPATVVGVLPETFLFPVRQEVWVPLRIRPSDFPRGEGRTFEVFGRLRDGVSEGQAARELAGIARRLELEYPASNEGVGVVLKPYMREFMGDENYYLGAVMLAAVFLVLLVACANVANLLLARTVLRTREIGVRLALGASRRRVVGLFLAEAFAIAAVGAVLGMGITWVGVRWFQGVMDRIQAPFWIDIRIDGASLLFVLLATAAAAVIAGALPAWQAARADLGEILRDESRGSSSFRIGRLSRGLVVFEVALSFSLLVAAGLLVKSVIKLNDVDYAFAREDVFTARIALMEAAYPTPGHRVRFHDELLGRLEALPGARSASLTTALPGFWGGRYWFGVEGVQYERPQDHPAAHRIAVSPGFFRTFGVQPVQGRGIEPQDREGSLPVVVVNESFGRRYLAGESLGKRVRLGQSDPERPWLTVVGVVPDMHAGGPQNDTPEAMYVPLAQIPDPFASVAVRTHGPPTAITSAVRGAVQAVDSDLPIYFVGGLADRMTEVNWQWRTFGTLFLSFGIAALILAAIGLYAVLAFAVSTRTREVGIRMALGAEAGHVVRMIVRQGMTQLLIGILLGLGLAVGLATALTQFLFNVQPRDPGVFTGILGLLLAIGLLAALIPAWRATRVDPVEALRSD